MPHVSWIRDREQLETIASDWNALSPAWPTQRFEWLTSAWDAFANQGRLAWGVVRDADGKLIGGLPLFRSYTVTHGRLLSLVGSGSVCSDGGGVTVEPGREQEVISALADSLLGPQEQRNESVLKWDELDWDGVSADDYATQSLINRLRDAQAEVMECGVMSTWRAELATRNAKEVNDVVTRSTKRKIKRLDERYHSEEVSFHEARNSQELDEAQEFAIRLHQQRQTLIGHRGCFACPRFERFYRQASGRLFARGLWRLFWVSINGQPASFFTGAFLNNVQYTYQTGMASELTEWEPGWLLQIHLLRKGLAEGWDAINFMRGDHEYKRLLGGAPTACRRVRVCHPRLSAQGRFKLFQLARNVKHWWDSVPSSLPTLANLNLFARASHAH